MAEQIGKGEEGLAQIAALAAHNHSDRQLLRVALLELLNYGRQGNKFLAVAEQLIQQDVRAENEDRKKEVDAKIRDQDERRAAKLAENVARRRDKEKREEQSQKRKNERHNQEMKERETGRIDGSRERSLFMALAAISVLATVFFGACTAAFLFLTAKYAQPWGYAGSAASLALTGIVGLTGGTPQRLKALFFWLNTAGAHGEATKDSTGR